ncbi:MAG: hypothetical protein DRP09_20445, partial [Candidatus Thorarchaeota archaeon]
NLIGFDLPLTVNISEMVRYHTGIFGFTGCGKSNLCSFLIRRALEKIEGISIVIFDVAGEYLIHLLDLEPRLFSTEDFGGNVDRVMDSQAMPETLEQMIDRDVIMKRIERLIDMGRIQRLSLSPPLKQIPLNMGFLLDLFGEIARGRRRGAVQAAIALNKINRLLVRKGYDDGTSLDEVRKDMEARVELEEILEEFLSSVHSMSGMVKDVQAVMGILEEGLDKGEYEGGVEAIRNAEWLAEKVAVGEYRGVNIVYLPDPKDARHIVSRFIEQLLWLKKTKGVGRTVLTVLDEAQEFIPDRTKKEDFTEQSNIAVEALLRQGRKYRANCWICSQRVAHLNVNALQQLHSYFVSVLPRFYDRMVIADAFSLSYDLLDRTTELDIGEWLFVSYKATKQRNVPAFIRTPNNEEIMAKRLQA